MNVYTRPWTQSYYDARAHEAARHVPQPADVLEPSYDNGEASKAEELRITMETLARIAEAAGKQAVQATDIPEQRPQ